MSIAPNKNFVTASLEVANSETLQIEKEMAKKIEIVWAGVYFTKRKSLKSLLAF